MNFASVKDMQIPQGRVKQIKDSQGNVLWNVVPWSVVPQEYQLLQYIQSSGTQYIDTGVLINYASEKIEQRATVQYTTSSSNRELMGANGYGFWGKAANNKLESAVGSSAGITESALSLNTVSLTTDPSDNSVVFAVGDKRYVSKASTFAAYDYACYICAIGGRDGAAASFLCKARVYDYMILLDDVVVSHLVPVKRYSDSAIGMYDIITQSFKTNAGTGSFTAGPVVDGVPTEYQLLEYLEANGTQYIDTGFLVTPKTQYVYRITPTTGSWFGGYTKGAAGRWGVSFNVTTGVTTLYSDTTTCQVTLPLSEMSEILFDFGVGITYKGNTVRFPSTPTKTSDFNGWLFKAQGSSAGSGGKIYAFTINQNGNKVRELVPCKRMSDGVLGMYDLVANQFLTNAGTGTFIAGNPL